VTAPFPEPTEDVDHPYDEERARASALAFGRPTMLDRLGTGGMADVFRAQDKVLNRNVAVQVGRKPI
jgi:hypothetical protein